MSQIVFHKRLATRGYYVPSADSSNLLTVPGPSQNRACATHAHGSSSLHSLRSEQVHHYTRNRQRELLEQLLKLLPAHASPLSATIEPFEQDSQHTGEELMPAGRVPVDARVVVGAPQLGVQLPD